MAAVALDAPQKVSQNQVERKHFETSRELDFFTESELVKQTGHATNDWPLVIIKELIDNALDACEEKGIAPVITVQVFPDGIRVSDNGPGLPPHVIKSMLNFSTRISSRSAYVAPDRGRQGNALKTIVAMPYVLSGSNSGIVQILSCNEFHQIQVKVDYVKRVPLIEHRTRQEEWKCGTVVGVELPESVINAVKTDVFGTGLPRSIELSQTSRFLPFLRMYTMLNPHMTLKMEVDGQTIFREKGSGVCNKWIPSNPTHPLWYELDDMQTLIAANVARDLDQGAVRTVRDFLSEFRGLSGTQKRKKVLESAGFNGSKNLSHLVTKSAEHNEQQTSLLLQAMYDESIPFPATKLGPVGKLHLFDQFTKLGATPESFRYKQLSGDVDGMPWIIEAAFGYRPGKPMCIMTGVNWSPAINNPFRQIGAVSLDACLSSYRVCDDSPVVFFLHLICPKVRYTDHGKTNIVVGPMSPYRVIKAVEFVTSTWSKQKKKEERNASAESRRDAVMNKTSRVHQLKAAYEVMRDAYMKASNNGTLPANARQIMYCARGPIQDATGENLKDKYFTQTILPRYMADHPKETADWDVVFDARGHFSEPHTGKTVNIGTLAVRRYLGERPAIDCNPFGVRCSNWPTNGAPNRFGAVLFVEKEGFNPLLERVDIASKFDIAIMSTKGMSTTSARLLIDRVCGGNNIPIFVMHDFDKAGFSILGTLTKTSTRYRFENELNVVDVGLRLSDVEEMELESESVKLGKSCPDKLRLNLMRNGATEAEADFLLNGQRVELNAMSASQFVEWLERKLTEHGVKKVVPEKDVLAQAYRRVVSHETIRSKIAELREEADVNAQDAKIPSNIRKRVLALLAKHPSMPWDSAIEQIVRSNMK